MSRFGEPVRTGSVFLNRLHVCGALAHFLHRRESVFLACYFLIFFCWLCFVLFSLLSALLIQHPHTHTHVYGKGEDFVFAVHWFRRGICNGGGSKECD